MTTQIKKVYEEVVAFLQANENKKVATLMPELLELMASKVTQKTFVTDDNGNVTHIFCYYHKKWEPIELFGNKKHSTTGYNTMCKVGVNQWTKQQRDARKAKEELLQSIATGELSPDELQHKLEQIEAEKHAIVPREDDIGTDTI